jgi:hypothetical protein
LGPSPRVLIAAWYRWPSAARVAAAFIAGGIHVDVVCPDFHPIQTLKGLSARHRFAVFQRSKSLASAIGESQPDIIIPCDNIALGELEALRKTAAPPIVAVIERSIGGLGGCGALTSRVRLIEAAVEVGVPCPPTAAAPSKEALQRWLVEHGTPAFLKLDGTFGGVGVRLMHDAHDAAAAFDALSTRPGALEALRHFLKRQEFSKALAYLGRTPLTLSVQKSVAGIPANCSAFAWQGEVRAVVSVEVVRTATEFGVATVVIPIENASIDAAARILARRLGLTGVFGLDFILEKETGRTWLIELNPRPTQISHMNFGPGRDLIAAVIHAIGDGPELVRPPLPTGAPIAIFPHCLRSGAPEGEAFEDLPFDQPALIRAFTPLRDRLRPAPVDRRSSSSEPSATATQASAYSAEA